MEGSKPRSAAVRTVLRWIARGWSLLSLGFVGVFVVGEALFPTATVPTSPRDLIGLSLFPFATCLGMVLAWRWEALGGAITVGSLAAFYIWMFILDGRFPRGPFFGLVAAPGALFALLWAMSRSGKKHSGHEAPR